MKSMNVNASSGCSAYFGMQRLSVQSIAPSSGTTNFRFGNPLIWSCSTSADHAIVSATLPDVSALT